MPAAGAKPSINLHTKLALTGFLLVSVLFLAVPFGFHKRDSPLVLLLWIYTSLSGAYVFVFPAVLIDILSKDQIWSETKYRAVGVPLFGALLGLFLVLWVALAGCTEVGEAVRGAINNIWNGKSPEGIQAHASDLLYQAELLLVCKTLVDKLGQYIAVFAGLAMLGIGVHDALKLRWPATSFLAGFILQLPFLTVGLIENPQTMSTLAWSLPYLFVTGLFQGIALLLFVWSVRAGWWSSSSPGWYSKFHPESVRENQHSQIEAVTKNAISHHPEQLVDQNRNKGQDADDTVDVEEGGVELGEVIRLNEAVFVSEHGADD
jgi:hypothetical protein